MCRVGWESGRQSQQTGRLEGSLLVARDPIPNWTQSGPARLGRRMTVPSHAVGDLDDVDDRLDALRKRLARGSDVSGTVGTAREARVSPERLSRESSEELSVRATRPSGPRDERPPRPRRAEPVDVMPSPTARSPRPSSPRSSTTAAAHRRWNAHYDVDTTPGGGRERAAAYGSPARFGIVPISPAPSLGVLAGDGDGRGRSIHDTSRGDSTRHRHRRGTRGDDFFHRADGASRSTPSIGDDDDATVTMTLRERDEIHAKLVRLTEERDASRSERASLARDLTATTVELDRMKSRYADVAARLDAVAEDLAAHRARVGSNPRGDLAAGAHPALAGATADARVAASELRAAVEDMVESIDDPDDPVGRRRVAGVVRERTRALIARAEDVAIAAMGEVAAAASREAATGGRRFKLPIY